MSKNIFFLVAYNARIIVKPDIRIWQSLMQAIQTVKQQETLVLIYP